MSFGVRCTSSMRQVASQMASRRGLHSTSARLAITNFQMPAMSPTMTEGGIASWKVKEGDSFSAGDVLLEIETDKATIDVEAQEDGILGKILASDGTKNVPVGKVIALLAEEGDDISNIEAPRESSSAPSPAPSMPAERQPSAAEAKSPGPSGPAPSKPHKHIEHSRPLFPSVLRLLQENDVPDVSKIKGTGIRGMLTKGDVLAFLGKASSPTGTFKEPEKKPDPLAKKPQVKIEPLDGPALRRLIVSNMLQASVKARIPAGSTTPYDFDSVISDYLPATSSAVKIPIPPPVKPKDATAQYFDGLI
ncbi:single hybrid motif-containing protein [Heliocybe sulcata]|uniref:Single hybrid motif-containing protein n=1 Tax=Heliocybe sulcata TaxID=5364 RepID=A0A5C3MND5_9AGAM|nr:single hybrid motif-containing protein [Heliocybe sulcata]